MRHTRLVFFGISLITGCAGLIGVPDLTYDEAASQGTPDGAIGADGTTGQDGAPGDGGSSDAPVTCNADLKIDKNNCGACNHDCGNGECKDGLCILTPELYGATNIAVSSTDVFIGVTGDVKPFGLVRCPTNGCASPSVAPKQISPDDAGGGNYLPYYLTVREPYVFTTNGYNGAGGAVLRTLTDGGLFAQRPPVTQNRSYGIAVDKDAVYWIEDEVSTAGALWWCAAPDCPTATKITNATSGDFLVVQADGRLVWQDNGNVRTCASKTACATPTDLPNPYKVNSLAAENGVAYWSTIDQYKIQSCTIAPACANPTTITTETASVTALVVSGSTLYWSTLPYDDVANAWKNGEGTIKSCTIGNCTGAGIRTLATKQRSPNALALDAKSVYWANSGTRGFTGGRGEVVKAPR